VILAVLSVAGGWIAAPEFWGGENHFDKFLEPAFADASEHVTQVSVDPASQTGKTMASFGQALVPFRSKYFGPTRPLQ